MDYPVESFTESERAALRPHFTNLDRPVFALIGLPETVKGAMFARYSRYQGTLPDVEWFQTMLQRHGYAVPVHGDLDKATGNVVRAFQMRYRPAKFDGVPDAETAAILDALVNP